MDTHSVKTKLEDDANPMIFVIDSQGNLYLTDMQAFVQTDDVNYNLLTKWLTVVPG